MNKFLHSLLIFSLITPSYLPAMQPPHMELPAPTEKEKTDGGEITEVTDAVMVDHPLHQGLVAPQARRAAGVSAVRTKQVRFDNSCPATYYQDSFGQKHYVQQRNLEAETGLCIFMGIMLVIGVTGVIVVMSQPDRSAEAARLAVPIQQCHMQAITQLLGSVPSEMQQFISKYSTRFLTLLQDLALTTPNKVEFAHKSAEYINREIIAQAHLHGLNTTSEIIEQVRTVFTNCTQTWLYPGTIPHQTSAAGACVVTTTDLVEFYAAIVTTAAIAARLA